MIERVYLMMIWKQVGSLRLGRRDGNTVPEGTEQPGAGQRAGHEKSDNDYPKVDL
jgi:hypothetical protein